MVTITDKINFSLKGIVEDSLNEIYVFDKDTFKFLMVNKGARQNLGYSMEELSLLTAVDIKPKITEKDFQALVKPLVDDELDKLIFNTVHRRKNGSDYDVEVHLSLSHHNGGSSFLALIYDVTERLKIGAKLRESEERYALAVAGSNDGIWDWNVVTSENVFSNRFKAILGYSEHEFPNHFDSFHEALHPEDVVFVEDAINYHLEKKGDYNVEYRLQHKGGQYIWIRAKGQAIWNDAGEPVRMVGSISDISLQIEHQNTLRIAKENAEKANSAKSEFLAAMSHDLRTPLNAILGFSDVIASERIGPNGNEKYREYGQDIFDSATYLQSLIEDLLDMSTIEAGQMKLNKERVDINKLITDCFTILKGQTDEAGVATIIILLEKNAFVHADKRAVMQVILNLVQNSIKNTPKDGTITLAAKASSKQLEISIEDTGIGIEKARISKLTEPFTKGEGDPLKTSKGWGLGLAISKSLVELHKGELIIESQVGKGTTVTISLPHSA